MQLYQKHMQKLKLQTGTRMTVKFKRQSTVQFYYTQSFSSQLVFMTKTIAAVVYPIV